MSSRSIKDYLKISAKGMAMGAADIVPGVSGGTIALITGIYAELLSSLRGLTPAKLAVLVKDGPLAFWQSINGNFLLALFAGILLSIKTLAGLVSWALEHHPLLLWGGFSGLILASLVSLYRQQARWQWPHIVLFALGAALVVGLALAKPTELPAYWWVLFLGGFIAISAMILPGISGSFILLLLGLYPQVLKAVETLDIVALAVFALGCICGLLLFSRFLSWLLLRWYQGTLAVMLGFLLGSLYVTWPWKQVLETTIDRHGEPRALRLANISPEQYTLLNGEANQWPAVLLCFALGAALVFILDRFSGSSKAQA
ncbi:DUF368 domain-containing protein [Agaribacterium haliotis]|uniref:DUF368 domain-containing protein n=1 Tax=Agaribacterium haliotis TaxID=2013869 RepID=UPI000BB58736|nr:DUF368 domain-containing protein [Agaribacterium haliotis]